MYKLLVHQDAAQDLEELWNTSEQAAARIAALLQEIQCDQTLLEALTDDDFGAYGFKKFHVKKWLHFWNKGFNLWRLKVWDLENSGLPYRIVYAYKVGRQQYYVLGIIHRNFNYDPNHPFTRRILRAYDSI